MIPIRLLFSISLSTTVLQLCSRSLFLCECKVEESSIIPDQMHEQELVILFDDDSDKDHGTWKNGEEYHIVHRYPYNIIERRHEFFSKRHTREVGIAEDYYYEDDDRLNRDMMWKILKCDNVFLEERPMHSEIQWKHAIQMYNSIKMESPRPILDSTVNGFNVLIEAKQSPGKGRGIFAAQTIRKGEVVWSTKRTARFDNGGDYIEFIYNLDPAFACDVLQWAYVQDVSKDGELPNLKISVDLDEGSFCNDSSFSNDQNLGCDPSLALQVDGGCTSNYFALQDIAIGEELLCDYSAFALAHGWNEFGL